MVAVDVHAELGGQVRPLRRAEYDRLVDQGAFDDEQIELIEGALVRMSPEGADHAWVVLLVRHTRPGPRGYGDVTTHGPDDSLRCEGVVVDLGPFLRDD